MGHFTLKVADRLSTAQESLANAAADIILLDLSLPDSHGLATIIKLRHAAARFQLLFSQASTTRLSRSKPLTMAHRIISSRARSMERSSPFDSLRHPTLSQQRRTQSDAVAINPGREAPIPRQMAASVAHEVKNPSPFCTWESSVSTNTSSGITTR